IEEDLSLPINQERLRRLILDLRKDSQLALLPKLNQELRPGAALQSLNDTGIAGWSLLDSLRTHLPPAGTDKYDSPTFQYAERPEAASLFGSWQLPLVCDYVSRLRANSSLPILAGGGVNSAYDIIRLLALGADAIQVASAILRDGPGWIRRTLTELNSYHPEKAAPKTPENIQCAKAVIQRGLCSSCGRCTRQLMCQAITMKQDGPHITPDACEGCGFCLSVCPEGAIVLHSIPDSR
ncbi:MAG: 4Fe-4S binding protein, partial [Chloroflexi bacterium]|nr:4Fe-4S binding protein [Chloroflexota bacterium]